MILTLYLLLKSLHLISDYVCGILSRLPITVTEAKGKRIQTRILSFYQSSRQDLSEANRAQDSLFTLPEKLKNDMNDFYQRVGELPNPDFFKNAGLRGLNAERLLDL